MTPGEMSRWLERMPQEISSTVGRALPRAGELLRTQIMANCAGRPGPNAPNGDYRGSWSVRPAGMLAVSVSTNRVQGPRLEFGFTGIDSLGRSYDQPPYAHAHPALRTRRDTMERWVFDAIEQAFG